MGQSILEFKHADGLMDGDIDTYRAYFRYFHSIYKCMSQIVSTKLDSSNTFYVTDPAIIL